MKKIAKTFKEQSQISIIKLLVTATAATSMALISSKLTTHFDSVYIFGIIAIISLFLNELYNVIFQWVKQETVAMIDPSKIENIEPEKVEVEMDLPQREKIGFFRRLGNFFNMHKNLRLILFFALVSSTVLGINYLYPRVEQTINPQLTVQEKIDSESKQEIIEEAKKEASKVLTTAPIAVEDKVVDIDIEDIESEHEVLEKSQEETENRLEDTASFQIKLDKKYARLYEQLEAEKSKVKELEEVYQDLLKSFSTLEKNYDKKSKEVKSLESTIDSIEKRLSDIEDRQTDESRVSNG